MSSAWFCVGVVLRQWNGTQTPTQKDQRLTEWFLIMSNFCHAEPTSFALPFH